MLDTHQIARFCEETLSLAKREAENGGLPFSAMLINEHGQCIGQGVNEVNALHDCTAHAEIQAIRVASKALGATSLKGATLFASGEPCGLCQSAIRLAKISKVIVLLDRHDVKELGFDYMWTYDTHNGEVQYVKDTRLPFKDKAEPFKLGQRDLRSIGL